MMGMLPGMGSMDTSSPKSRADQQKAVKSFMYMIDSMSDDELDGKVVSERNKMKAIIILIDVKLLFHNKNNN